MRFSKVLKIHCEKLYANLLSIERLDRLAYGIVNRAVHKTLLEAGHEKVRG